MAKARGRNSQYRHPIPPQQRRAEIRGGYAIHGFTDRTTIAITGPLAARSAA